MGFLDILTWPFSYVFELCYFLGRNYAVALLLFAIVIKIVLLPLSIKQQKNQIKSAKLRPKIALIEKKYAGRTDQKTLNKKRQEILDLQTKEGASPMAGCLPLLIQLPIIFALYQIVRRPLTWLLRLDEGVIKVIYEKINGSAIENIKNLDEITLIGQIQSKGADFFNGIEGFDFAELPNLGFFGKSLAEIPSFSSWLVIIPILVYATSFLSMKLTRKLMAPANPMSDDQKTSMMIMDFAMPLMSVFFSFRLSSALGLYWIYQTVVSFIQSLILAFAMPLPKYTEEEIKQYMREVKGKGNKQAAQAAEADDEEKEPPRSLHYIDEEDDDDDDYTPPPKKKQPQRKSNSNIGRADLK